MKTIGEVKSEIASMRKEMQEKGAQADTRMVASWVSKLAMSLEGLCERLEMMSEEMDEVAETEK